MTDLSLYESCRDSNHLVESLSEQEDLCDSIQQSLDVLREAFEQFQLQEISISYNGGKDCLVMLILLQAFLFSQHPSKTDSFWLNSKLEAVYIRSHGTFQEIDDFVDRCQDQYHLNVVRLTNSMKPALEDYLHIKPDVRAICVGIRRTDPYGQNLYGIQPTDHGWPQFIRIHPILHWRYSRIWQFILQSGIEYCCLYDKGYTSLGSSFNTYPNPLLREGERYLPAYKLPDSDNERLGREQDSRHKHPI